MHGGRQADRQAGRQAGRQEGRQSGRQTDRQAGSKADRQTDRKKDRQTDIQTDIQTDRQTDKQTNRQTYCRGTKHPIKERSMIILYYSFDISPAGSPDVMFKPLRNGCMDIPVSRFEFTWIYLATGQSARRIGLGMRTWSVYTRCRDPAGHDSDFFVRVSPSLTFNLIYCCRQLTVSTVVSAIFVFRLVDSFFV